MTTAMLTPDVAIQTVMSPLRGEPVCGAGSAFAALYYGKEGMINGIPVFNDVDVFVPSELALASTTQILLCNGFTPIENMHRRWQRWKESDTNGWHTNSMILEAPNGVMTNVIYKTINRHPLPDLYAVLPTFDFGYLACGYTAEDETFRTMYDYFYPGQDPKGDLGLLPRKAREWKQGLFSKHVGLRESGRLARSVLREYPMDKSIPVMHMGYLMAALYYEQHDSEESQWYHKMYTRIAECVDWSDWDELLRFDKMLKAPDPVVSIIKIMEGRP